MSRKIINAHAHLGDIFNPTNAIYRQNATMSDAYDPFTNHEAMGFEGPLIGDDIEELYQLHDVSFERCWNNTLQNMQKEMDRNGVNYTCLMPICPTIRFEDYLAASKMDSRLIPFTSADFALGKEAGKKLLEDVKNGAKGWKIHPVLQCISLQDELVTTALQYWEETGLPVISHCGANPYYHGEDAKRNVPEYGDVKYFIEMIKKFPRITFIAAHAGGLMGGEMEILAEETAGLDNLYVDTTFRSVADMKKMLELFSRERIIFGSDTPFTSVDASLKVLDKVFGDDKELENLILFENANRLLNLK